MLNLFIGLIVLPVVVFTVLILLIVLTDPDTYKKRRKRQGEYELSEGEKENLRRMDALDRKLRAKRARERRLYGK